MKTKKGEIKRKPDYTQTLRDIEVGASLEYALEDIRAYNSIVNAKCRLQKSSGSVFKLKTVSETSLIITRLS